jgi:small-conductance mechanosensitive channel
MLNNPGNAIRRADLIAMIVFWAAAVWAACCPSVFAAEAEEDIPLVVGHRTIHVFRAPFGAFSAADRAAAARKRIEEAIRQPGEGWTSVKSTPEGVQVELDGKLMFLVIEGDAHVTAGETPEDLANAASRTLQMAWSEARERRDHRPSLPSLLKLALATLLLLAAIAVTTKLSYWLRSRLARRMTPGLRALASRHLGTRAAEVSSAVVARVLVLLTWVAGLFLVFVYVTYSLGLFALTRPASEALSHSIAALLTQALHAVSAALPGTFIAVLIFLAAWVATRTSTAFFDNVEARPSSTAMLNTHTAPTTRRIVNTLLWLFAIAMAYPYLPGSHTEAFKGLSVIVGLMVSIGAAGVVGQVASGVMIVYTYAIKVGEYVRIQEHEGTVTELGLFVTRLRTGLGEEIALPNNFVLANVTRNFSRARDGDGHVLDVTITIGYDTPWRQVHAMLLEAARSVPQILATPQPCVVQTALSDFYVAYRLVAHIDSQAAMARALVASDLQAAIQDAFNRHGVQIMSPHYVADPERAKIVPESCWHGHASAEHGDAP